MQLNPTRKIRPQAAVLHRELCRAGQPIKYSQLVAGLRQAARFRQEPFETSPWLLKQIQTGKIFKQPEITKLSLAKRWVTRFLYAYAGLPAPYGAASFGLRNEPRPFFVRGPMTDIPVGLSADPRFCLAALPGANLPKGKLFFIRPKLDNLVMIQFRLLDANGKLIKTYAYDASQANWFEEYSYADEEARQFEFFNGNLLTQEERIKTNNALKLLSQIVNGNRTIPDKLIFKLAGPARQLTIKPSVGESFELLQLGMQPTHLYHFQLGEGLLPGTGRATLTLTRTSRERPDLPVKYYWQEKERAFAIVFATAMDERGRIKFPPHLQPCLAQNADPSRLVVEIW